MINWPHQFGLNTMLLGARGRRDSYQTVTTDRAKEEIRI